MNRKFLQMSLLLMLGVFLSSALMAQVNMDRYITLTGFKQGDYVRIILAGDVNYTPVKIVSGSKVYEKNVSKEPIWDVFDSYTAGASTMTI